MRIACVNQDPGIAPERKKGAAVHLRAVRNALAATGAEVHAIDRSSGRDVEQRLSELVELAHLDLIYERFALGSTAAASFAAQKGIPLVLEMNAPLSSEASRWRGIRIAEVLEAERFVVARATKILAVSSLVADYALELGAAPSIVEVVPNGVDPAQFHPRASDELRRRLVPEGHMAIGFHGRLRPWHGFSSLVDVTAALIECGLPVHLVIVGEGEFEQQLVGRIGREHVTQVGWMDHDRVGEYVATFDVLPLNYSPESPCYFSPLKLMEAMACGVVPVVPDLGDLGMLVEHNTSGLVYPASRPGSLHDALLLLAKDTGLRDRLAVGAVSRTRAFEWERVARIILEVVASGAGPRTGGVRRR